MRPLVLLLPLAGASLTGCTPTFIARSNTPSAVLATQARGHPTDVQTCAGTRYDRVSVTAQGPDSLALSADGLPLARLSLATHVRRVTVFPRRSRVPYYVAGGVLAVGGAVAYAAPVPCRDGYLEGLGCAIDTALARTAVLSLSGLIAGLSGYVTADLLGNRPTVEHRYDCARPVE